MTPAEIAAALLAEKPRWHGWALELESPVRLGFVSSADGICWGAYEGVQWSDCARIGTFSAETAAKGAVEGVFRARGWEIPHAFVQEVP